jgi:hypothetical protein
MIKPLALYTERDLVEHFYDRLTGELKRCMLRNGMEGVQFRIYYTRCIRNEAMLWSVSRLTKSWRTEPQYRVVVNGIDHSDDHPDAVSARVFNQIKQRVIEETLA